jgi:glycosyltransferase involved in cell wall biosynthesis
MTHKQPTISLVVIHRRAGHGLARAVLSALRQVDEVVLVDTGPSDDDEATQQARAGIEAVIGPACEDEQVNLRRAEFKGDEFLHDGKRFTADFAQCRNFAHSLATCDWELMLDADDTLMDSEDPVSLREIIAEVQALHLGVGEFSMSYEYGAGVQQDRVRLWRRRVGWEWRGALHEERHALAPGRHTRCQIGPEHWLVVHNGDAKASRARNAALLRHMWQHDQENEFTPQMDCAFAAVLLDDGDPAAVIASLAMAYDAPRAPRALFHSLRAEAFRRLGSPDLALAELGAALALTPHDRARWAELGLEWAELAGAAAAAHIALDAAYHVLPQEGWSYLAPRDWFEGEARQKAEAFLDQHLAVEQRGHEVFARRGKDNGPRAMNRIDFVVASPVTGWGPGSTKFVGGSELAMLEVAPRLAMLGLDVRVWALGLEEACGATAGPGGAVAWGHLADFNPSEPRGAVVVWRDPRRIKGCQGFGYPVWLWAHDIPEAFGAEGLHLADKVFALSEHHARRFAHLGVASERIIWSQNGLNALEVAAAQFMNSESDTRRDPHRVVYCSSANRGLLLLLDMWPRVRAAVPDATLEVCYGLDLFKHKDTPPRLRGLPELVLRLCEQPGVTFRGGLPHGELLRLLGTAGVWAYPCVFEEIFCIAAIEAQAMGAWPVTTDSAALAETVKGGFKMPLRQLQDECDLTAEERALGEVWQMPRRGSRGFLEQLVVTLLEPPDEAARVNLSNQVLSSYDWANVAAHFASALKESENGSLRQDQSGSEHLHVYEPLP